MEKKAFSTWGTTILLLNKWVYRKSTVASCVTNFKTKETNKFLKRIDTKNFTRLPNQFSNILSHPLPWEYPLTNYDRNDKSTMSWKGNSVAAEIHLRIFLAITVTMIGHLFELAKVQTSQFHFHRANYATDIPLPPIATFLSFSVSESLIFRLSRASFCSSEGHECRTNPRFS